MSSRRLKQVCGWIMSGVLFISSGTGSSLPVQAESAKQEAPRNAEIQAEKLSEEDEYVQKHLDFCDSPEYREIKQVMGGLATSMAMAYEEARLNAVNKTWSQLSSFSMLIGAGEADAELASILNLRNEYDLLVSYLMQTTAAQEAFEYSYSQAYANASLNMLLKTKEVLGAANESVQNIGDADLGKAEDVAERIDQILAAIQQAGGVSGKDIQTLYTDGIEEIKQKIDSEFLAPEKEKLCNAMLTMDMISGFADVASATYSDMVDAYLLYSACTQATEQWKAVWTMIADSAAGTGVDGGRELSESIRNILNQVDAADKDMTKALVQKVINSGEGHTAAFGLKMASDAWDDRMKAWDLGQAIRDGLVAGVTVSNKLMNCDDIAYYGQMLLQTGLLAIHSWDALSSAEASLRANRDFESALLFDEAFNIYKEVQLAAFDYAGNYSQEIATAPAGYIFKYTVDDEIAATVQMQVEKAIWSEYNCHKEAEVINNGGRFVGYKNKTYYCRFAPGSIAMTGILGNFDLSTEVQSELVCRTADGQETVLLKDVCGGNIYICGNLLYYNKAYNVWGVCRLDGTPVTTYDAVDLLGVDAKRGVAVAYNYEEGIFALNPDGGKTSLAPPEANFIGIHDYRLYYHVFSENQMNIYSVRLDGTETASLGRITGAIENMFINAIGDSLVRDDGIYMSVGCYGGTGAFFNGGGLYRINYTGSIDTLLTPNESLAVNFPKIYVTSSGPKTCVYFYGGEGYSNVGYWDSWVDENVYELDLQTKKITESDFTLSNTGDAVFKNGSVKTLLGESTLYTEILSPRLAAELGYSSLGTDGSGSQVFVQDLDIVDDTAYFTLARLTEDSQYSLGWRTGYRRDLMRTYVTKINSGKAELINEY